MDRSKHCSLCEHQLVNLKDGTICALTHKKPMFDVICPEIQWSVNFEEKLKKTNIAYERVKRTKIVTYSYFVVFCSMGLAVMTGGYFLGEYAFDSGVLSTIPLIIIGIGFVLLAMGIGPLNTYKRDISLTKRKKKELDDILGRYHIGYTIDMEFGKEVHGTREARAEVHIRKTYTSPYNQIH